MFAVDDGMKSALTNPVQLLPRRTAIAVTVPAPGCPDDFGELGRITGGFDSTNSRMSSSSERFFPALDGRDRKIVVEGQSVSEREDLGGCRVIQKKKIRQQSEQKKKW